MSYASPVGRREVTLHLLSFGRRRNLGLVIPSSAGGFLKTPFSLGAAADVILDYSKCRTSIPATPKPGFS